MRKAFVTGAGGQDGSYMCDLLLEKGYEVEGLVRPSGDIRTRRLAIDALMKKNFSISYGDILDPQLSFKIADGHFDEVYHFAAQSHVHHAFYTTAHTINVNATATAWLLDAIWTRSPKTKFFFAATSEMFGDMKRGQWADEDFPLSGRSPYAAAKIAAHILCRVFRNYGMFVVSGISFNHESSRRGENFVTRKVALGLKDFKKTGKKVNLGNLDAYRDWHHAWDTVQGIYAAMQHDESGEYVFASGTSRTVRELLTALCVYAEVDPEDAIQICKWEKRPWDVDYLCGNPGRAEKVLGWKRKWSFSDLIEDLFHVD